MTEPSEAERAANERARALVSSLTASRQETYAARRDLADMTEKFEACREALDRLLGELQAEGTTLQQLDRERLRKTVRDLRDYELYKNVMEAAMVRLPHTHVTRVFLKLTIMSLSRPRFAHRRSWRLVNSF